MPPAKRPFGEHHPDTLTARDALGRLLTERGEVERAEPLLRDVLAARRAGGSPLDVAQALNSLALAVQRRTPATAAELLREALGLREAQLGPQHALVLESKMNLAVVLRTLGRPFVAEPLMREVVARAGAILPGDHPHQAVYAARHAACISDCGRPAEALIPLRDAWVRLAAAYGGGHPRAREVVASLHRAAECMHPLIAATRGVARPQP